MESSGVKRFGKQIGRYLVIAVSCLIYSVGIAVFLDPNDLAPGGVSGVAIILNHVTAVETGTLILLMNVPILFLGLWKFGAKFLSSTIYAVLLITLFTNELEAQKLVFENRMLAALAGAVLCASSMAVIFRLQATTGGVDILVKILKLRFPHLKTGVLFLGMDIVVISLSGIVFGELESVLYALIAVAVQSKMFDLVLYGSDEAKLFYIISDKPDQIAERLMVDLDVGVTYLKGSGAYSMKEKTIILCVVQKKTAPKIREFVKEIDTGAFMIMCSASEIFGEGYKSYDSEVL